MSKGVISMGIHCPLIKEGDNLQQIVIDSILKTTELEDGDIIGITESVVARSAGMYVDLVEIGKWIQNYKPQATHLVLYSPIFSRNRFVPILRGLLTASNITKVTIISKNVDEVGNLIEHPITKVNYKEYYKEWVQEAGKEFEWVHDSLIGIVKFTKDDPEALKINCKLHTNGRSFCDITLQDIFHERNYWGLLGMNAAGNNRLKLFPDKYYAQSFVDTLQQIIKKRIGKKIEVMIYGDGAYKDPVSGIWEWADPVVSPAWTSGLDGMPAEIKLKNAIDSGLSEEEIRNNINKNKETVTQQLGTTPRRRVDLLGSLMDLTSGSGDKGTPIVLVKNYFKNFATC